ncbi:MAG: leucine--tRNA ligase [Gammaproteobacteria bacterium]|nr:leucine--tRNA ligase [Gammaproteobacteria bacterium]
MTPPQDIYKPEEIEPRAQALWDELGCFRVVEDGDKEEFYCLSMLPYPSGALHMGHVRNYTIGDVISRYQRMLGKNVLQPMGWDAFGLPAENAAIKNKVPPARWTYQNIDHMRAQLKRLGFAYDWSREFATCDPEYYRWEQQMFVRLYAKGLVYRKNATVNWDPVDQTVLANEQVIDGKGWRSGAPVQRKEIPQWFLKITDYAQELLDCLDDLDGWPDSVKTMQRNWIGRSEGVQFWMPVCDEQGRVHDDGHRISVFTTRPDTSFGMTYAVLAPEHPLAQVITADEQSAQVQAFIARAAEEEDVERMAEGGQFEKRGVFTGAYLLNPFTSKPVPLYLADYVLMSYGTGAIMAVPGQDQRDWDFAKAHNLPIVRTVQPPDDFGDAPYLDEGPAINSEWLNGLSVADAKEEAIRFIEREGMGERKVNFRLRDWGVSRQRYWGCPIPMIYCADCGEVPVPEDQLPVVLPEDVKFMGVQSPIKADPEWRKTRCPNCSGAAERETDTFDTFMESSWYYARYCSPGAQDQIDDRANYWLPVDQYIGGIEHAILHLMYFRFYHKVMRDLGMVQSNEPATRLLCQGMVVAETYYRETADGTRNYFNPAEVEIERDSHGAITGAALLADKEPVTVGPVEKMSKSRNNGVDPQALIERYGADTVRLFTMFASPPDQSLEWSESGVEGASRFLRKLWRNITDHLQHGQPKALQVSALNDGQRDLRRKVHETIAKVSDDVGRRYTFNTAIAAIMELQNALVKHLDDKEQDLAVAREAWVAIVVMLAPMVPHVAEELWRQLGGKGTVVDAAWPRVDEAAMQRSSVDIVVQVNGKLRGKVTVAVDADRDQVTKQALAEENVVRFIGNKQVRKVIVVPGRLVNVVV